MIRFGIIGCGGAALPVAQAIFTSPVTRLAGVFDLDSSLSGDLAVRFGGEVAYSQEALLSNPQIDAVYVAVPHDLLYPIARNVLEAGKHALVEKPMAIQLAEADELLSLAQECGLCLGVYYELRHAGPYQAAHQLVQAGAIGPVIGVRIQTLIDKPPHYWQSGYSGRTTSPWRGQRRRAGGGVLLMNTSHLLDAAAWITGLQVAQVTGVTATLTASVEVEDLAAATLVYDNGAIGSIMAGAHLAGAQVGDERIELYGALGQLRIPDPYGNGQLEVFLRRAWQELEAGVWHKLPAPLVDVHRSSVEEFALAVRRGEEPGSSGKSARHVLATVLAIYQSAAESQMVSI